MKILSFPKKQITMREQITILFICLVTLPILFINIVSSNIFIKSTEKDLKTIYTSNIREMGSNLEVIFGSALDMTLYPLMEQSLRTYLTTSESVPNFMIIKQNAGNMLNTTPYGYRAGIHDIGLHTETGNYIITNNNVKLTSEDLDVLSAMKTEPYWDFSHSASSRDYIYLLRHLRNPSDLSQYVGYIKMSINSSELKSTMLKSLQNNQTSYFLMTPDSALISWVDSGHYLEQMNTSLTYQELSTHGKTLENSWIWNQCIVSSYLLDNGLVLYSITQPEVLTQVRHTFYDTMAVCGVLVFIFSALLSLYFSKIITKPLKSLGNHMTSLSNEDFSVRADIKGCSEITVLTGHFNDMANRLEFLYKKVYLSELKLKQSQLDMLQTQLNPHFLYNTLDTIYWMAKMGKTDYVSNMVSNLSQMMRMTLTPKTNDKVTLAQELEHLFCYIAIQRIRYNNKIDFQVSYNKKLEQIHVLSFLLQPLVENALIHGLSDSLDGIVRIRIYQEEKTLVYEVANNGIPIREEEIAKILTSPDRSLRGFALRNIAERIQLKYGAGYSLSCFLDQGFSVFKITQPIEGADANDENTTC